MSVCRNDELVVDTEEESEEVSDLEESYSINNTNGVTSDDNPLEPILVPLPIPTTPICIMTVTLQLVFPTLIVPFTDRVSLGFSIPAQGSSNHIEKKPY